MKIKFFDSYLFTSLTAVLLFLTSCQGGGAAALSEGESVEMQYASLLSMHEGKGYISVEITNPWDTAAILHRYVLVPRDKELPASLPEGEVVRTPVTSTVVYTSVHCGLIDEFGAFDAVKGVCDSKYISLDKCRKGLAEGTVTDLGEGASPDIEKIIDLSPDAILLSPFQNSGNYGRLGKLGIPIIECADYMENSALGRAEWMRFYGLLFGKETVADSIFNSLAQEYNDLKTLTHIVKQKPRVIADLKFGSSWYISGANSATGRLFADAGADYVFADEQTSGSVPYDPEVVFDRAQDADIWIIKYNQAADKTYDELAHDYANYAQMKAFKTRSIYACNTSKIAFYEETPYHPERLLKDYIKIFHPTLLPDYQARYFSPL